MSAHNRVDELIEATGMSTRDFARLCGLNEQTVYKLRKKPAIKSMTIDVFLKIAHGLGMSAEELYYGTQGRTDVEYDGDPRKADVDAAWETVNEDGRQLMWANAMAARSAFPDA